MTNSTTETPDFDKTDDQLFDELEAALQQQIKIYVEANITSLRRICPLPPLAGMTALITAAVVNASMLGKEGRTVTVEALGEFYDNVIELTESQSHLAPGHSASESLGDLELSLMDD